jgi:hypothetical protein
MDFKPLQSFPSDTPPHKKSQREILQQKVAAKKEKEKRLATLDDADGDESTSQRAPAPISDEEKAALAKKRNRQRWIGVIGFFSIVPIAFSMPYIIGFVLDIMRDRGESVRCGRDCDVALTLAFWRSRLFEADLGFGSSHGGGAVFLQEEA